MMLQAPVSFKKPLRVKLNALYSPQSQTSNKQPHQIPDCSQRDGVIFMLVSQEYISRVQFYLKCSGIPLFKVDCIPQHCAVLYSLFSSYR